MLIGADIVFTGSGAVLPSSALNKNYVTNFSTLRSMGDSLVNSLAKNLGLVAGGSPTTFTTTAVASLPTSGSCSWSGHCAGGTTLIMVASIILANVF